LTPPQRPQATASSRFRQRGHTPPELERVSGRPVVPQDLQAGAVNSADPAGDQLGDQPADSGRRPVREHVPGRPPGQRRRQAPQRLTGPGRGVDGRGDLSGSQRPVSRGDLGHQGVPAAA